jgi:hypothetical protein
MARALLHNQNGGFRQEKSALFTPEEAVSGFNRYLIAIIQLIVI